MSPGSTAGADRPTAAELQRHADYFADGFITRHLLDAIPTVLLILNRQRQIVYANRPLIELTGVSDASALSGRRPGEALHCIHSRKSGGCGSAEPCQTCGVLGATLASFEGSPAERECRITRHREGQVEALDLRIWATPLEYAAESFTIFSIADISHEKRRQALERLFFHDILNLAGGIRGFSELLLDPSGVEDTAPLLGHVRQAAERIIDEIQAQRTLMAAENQDLQPRPEVVAAAALLEQVCTIYRFHEVCRDRELRLDTQEEGGILSSDATLLGRVLGNMVKNALEATPRGRVVTVGSRRVEDEIEFWVHNPGTIAEPVRLQIFQRSFSTRGAGRGLGTYSMRLLCEDYLGGRIGFTSTADQGTRFFVRFPRQWQGR